MPPRSLKLMAQLFLSFVLPRTESDSCFFPIPEGTTPEKKLQCAILGRAIADIEYYALSPHDSNLNYHIALDAWCYIHTKRHYSHHKTYLFDLTQILTALYFPYEESIHEALKKKYPDPPTPPLPNIDSHTPSPPVPRRKKFKCFYN